MHLSRKHIAIIAFVIALVVSNIAFAVLYMMKSVDITGGIAVAGQIQVYDDDGVTPLTGYDFPLFVGGNGGWKEKYFYVNNTGNMPVYVYWNISSSNWVWFAQAAGYYHVGMVYHTFDIRICTGPGDYWTPNDYEYGGEALQLDPGEGQECYIFLLYSGLENNPGTFTLTMSFYAQDA